MRRLRCELEVIARAASHRVARVLEAERSHERHVAKERRHGEHVLVEDGAHVLRMPLRRLVARLDHLDTKEASTQAEEAVEHIGQRKVRPQLLKRVRVKVRVRVRAKTRVRARVRVRVRARAWCCERSFYLDPYARPEDKRGEP